MFQKNIALAAHSNYKIGGPASYFVAAKNAEKIEKILDKWRGFHQCGPSLASIAPQSGKFCPHIFILGGGTNLLISDEGFGGLVLKPEIETLKSDDGLIRVGAGISMAQLLSYSIAKKFSGLEWAGGLPGTVGGAIRGNAGAFGGEIKDTIKEVISLGISGKTPKIIRRSNKQCEFGYRDSIFKQKNNQEIILEAAFILKKGDRKAIEKAIEEKIRYREEHQPLEYPNIGSIFKNVDLRLISKKSRSELAHVIKTDPFPVVPTAYLISECGLKGVSCGGAMISPKHPNFIVNALGASAKDVKSLIDIARYRVKEKFGIALEEEIQYLK